MCGRRSSILHYGPLIETNSLYVPTPNGQKPECVAKQTQYPPPLPDSQPVFMTHISDQSVVATSEQTGEDVYGTCKVWDAEKTVNSV